MNKSILILDTPSSCVICPLSFYNDYYKEHQCRGREYYRTIQDYKEQGKYIESDDKRPSWCPLSPVPILSPLPTLSHSQLLKPDKEAIEKRDALIKDIKLRYEDDGTMIVETEE